MNATGHVLLVLAGEPNAAMSTDTVCRLVARRAPTLSHNTIRRVLRRLAQNGLVDSNTHYDRTNRQGVKSWSITSAGIRASLAFS